MKTKYVRTSNAVFNLGYHITWCPKYRKGFLLKLNQSFIHRTFQLAAIKVKGIIENIEIMPDHIHVFLRLKRNHLSVPSIMQIIKGYSSFVIRKKYEWMRKYKALWSPGYFIESVGNMSEKVIKKYIDNQKVNLKPDYKYKNMLKGLKTQTINDYAETNKRKEEIKDNSHRGYEMHSQSFESTYSFSKFEHNKRTDVG